MVNALTLLNSKRKIAIVCISAVILLASGVGGYLYTQNKSNRQNANTANNNYPSAPSNQNLIEEEPSEQPVDSQYLVLDNWGVKFIIPDGLVGIRYYYSSEDDSYSFSTERVEALGGQCREPAEYDVPGVIRLVGLGRSLEPIPDNSYRAPYPLNNNKSIDDRYYSYSASQSSCAKNPDPGGLQFQDLKLLESMLKNIEST